MSGFGVGNNWLCTVEYFGGEDGPVWPGRMSRTTAASYSRVVLVEGIRVGESIFWGQYAGYRVGFFLFCFPDFLVFG